MKKIPVVPAAPAAEKQKKPMSSFSKAMMAITGVLALILLGFTVFDMSGYHLLSAELVPIGCVFEMALLLVWVCGIFARRRKTEHGQRIFTLASSLVIMLLGLLVCNYVLQYIQIVMPTKYAVLESPEGQKIAVLQGIDNGFAGNEASLAMLMRMEERQAYRDAKTAEEAGEPAAEVVVASVPRGVTLDANGEIYYDENGLLDYDLEAYDYETYGYVYGAYPIRMGIFYDTNVECDGLIYRGVESSAKIMHEWLADGTLTLYLESPEPGDSGKLSLHPELPR